MYFGSVDELRSIIPIHNGVWNKDYLYEYLIQSCNREFSEYISAFFADYKSDEKLADLLFEILLDDYYDGSDAQMGAAKYIGKLSKELLMQKRDLLLKAQKNEVFWKRPFPHTITLAECEHYAIMSTYETVSLIDKTSNTEVIIGDFYGDPEGAFIDSNERFAVMYGCGLIVYFLYPPFEEYSYNTQTKQWFEMGRNEPVMWIDNVMQISDNEIKVIFEDGHAEIISVVHDKFR